MLFVILAANKMARVFIRLFCVVKGDRKLKLPKEVMTPYYVQ